jgi:hypothetical protein
LPQSLKLKRKISYKDSLDLYSRSLMEIFDPEDMLSSLNMAQKIDPDVDHDNPEGRFVPLFKSTLFSIRYPEIISYIEKNQPQNIPQFYQQFMSKIFSQQFGPLEILRQKVLKKAWISTIEYMAKVRQDRLIGIDPVAVALGQNTIRGTIHPKNGQVGLVTICKGNDTTQPWHGTGYLRKSRESIKGGVSSVLELESSGAIPVCIVPSGTEDPLDKLADQPFLYIEKEVTLDQNLTITRSR